jgi:phosphatidylserine/phosphatidylglycerophosphate/cardiolipin synthase-like enzyme
MKHGIWELSGARLEQLAAALGRRGGEVVTEVGLQADGFERAQTAHLVGLSATSARVVVEAVLAERTVHPRPELELVWTGREGGPTMSRDTAQVLPALFARAQRRVIVAGFAFHGAHAIFEPLHARAAAGVEVEFFIHVDGTGRDPRMSAEDFFASSWPWRDATPRLYYDARADDGDGASTMHAKCVVVDEREVLVTSANFTGRAQRRNVELGVLIHDDRFAAQVAGQWRALVAQRLFVPYA